MAVTDACTCRHLQRTLKMGLGVLLLFSVLLWAVHGLPISGDHNNHVSTTQEPIYLPLKSHRHPDLAHLRFPVAGDRTRLMKLRQMTSSSLRPPQPPFDSPLGGSVWPTGGYFASIGVGAPIQEQLVQIDTGSSDLLVAQVGCAGCPSQYTYDPQASLNSVQVVCDSTYNVKCDFCANGTLNNCYYNNTYQTCDYSDPDAYCSLLGPTWVDDVSLGAQTLATAVFGGITLHAGAHDDEWTNMPGVMGMGFPAIAGLWLGNTVFDTLVHDHELKNMFAMCIGDEGGHLTLGGMNSSLYTGDIQYTPVIAQAWYVLSMTGFGFNSQSLDLDPIIYNQLDNGTILDSGTYNLVIPQEAYDALQAGFSSLCSSVSLHGVCDVPANATIFSRACYNMSASQIASYPNVSVWLEGIDVPLNIPPQDYLLPQGADHSICMGIQSSGPGGFTILGNIFQRPFYIIFDRDTPQLGIATASPLCNSGGLSRM